MKKKTEWKTIELVFENCEYCIIPIEKIKSIVLTDFNKVLSYSNWNGDRLINTCSLEYLEIDKRFLKSEHSIMGDTLNKEETLYNRIKKYSDIVSIELHNKKESFNYYLPWNDEDEYKNRFQRITENDDYLQISVKRGNGDPNE